MKKFQVPDDVGVDAFFCEYLPAQFGELIGDTDMSAFTDKLFTVQFDIDNQRYGLKISNGKDLEVVKGGLDNPMLSVALSEQDWRDSVTGKLEGGLDQFMNPAEIADIKKYNVLTTTKGLLKMDIRRTDGGTLPLTIVFNGEEKPAVTINLDFPDLVALQQKQTTGPNLFMSGKLKFTGDMVLLMKLQTLL